MHTVRAETVNQHSEMQYLKPYRAFCARSGEYVRNSAEFYAAVEQRGIGRRKKTEGRFVTGVRLTESDFI